MRSPQVLKLILENTSTDRIAGAVIGFARPNRARLVAARLAIPQGEAAHGPDFDPIE